MAYAGTPTGLAQQAGASRPWKTVLAAIAVLAIGLALVIAVMFINSRAVAPATGRDDGVIEAQRDATLLSGANSKIFVSDEPQHRARLSVARACSKLSRARAAARAGVPAVPAVIDESYNTEGLRGIAPATGRDAGLPRNPRCHRRELQHVRLCAASLGRPVSTPLIEAEHDGTLLSGAAAAVARAETRLDAMRSIASTRRSSLTAF